MKAISYYIDLATCRLVTASGANEGRTPEWIRGDKYTITLQFLAGESPAPLPEDVVYRFGIKPLRKYRSAFLAFSDLDRFTAVPAAGTVTFVVDLNTNGLDALLNPDGSDGKEDEMVNAEVEMIDGDGNPSTVARFRVNIVNDVINGTEGIPDTTTPDYVDLNTFRAMVREITHPSEGYYRLENGTLYLWDAARLVYSPVALHENGVAVLEGES